MNAVKEPGLLDAEEDQILSPEDESSCQKYLIFVIDNLRLGVDVKYVVEILNNHSATYLPMMPDYIRGIFNMRGRLSRYWISGCGWARRRMRPMIC